MTPNVVGPTLVEVRERIESLATAGGAYCLVCARTGERPVPAEGLRFPDPETARTAARSTEEYRSLLRRYDSRLPRRDVIVARASRREPGTGHTECVDATDWTLSDPVCAHRHSDEP